MVTVTRVIKKHCYSKVYGTKCPKSLVQFQCNGFLSPLQRLFISHHAAPLSFDFLQKGKKVIIVFGNNHVIFLVIFYITPLYETKMLESDNLIEYLKQSSQRHKYYDDKDTQRVTPIPICVKNSMYYVKKHQALVLMYQVKSSGATIEIRSSFQWTPLQLLLLALTTYLLVMQYFFRK